MARTPDPRKGPQYIYGTPIKELERDAQSAMLTALLECQEHVGLVRLQRGFSIDPIRKRVAAAIAAAEAAGIKPSTGA